MKRKGFTLVELLAVIVILAILMVAAGSGVIATMNNSKVNIFKNEVATFMDGAQRAYTAVSTDSNLYEYVKADRTDTTGAICISLAGLVNNGFVDKDIGMYAGVFIVEIPFDGGTVHTTAWVHNSAYGINGIGKEHINKLSFKKENNTVKLQNEGASNMYSTEEISGGPLGLVTNLSGIRKVIANVYPSATSVGIPNDIEDYKTINIKTYVNRGGDGKVYEGLKCINVKL